MEWVNQIGVDPLTLCSNSTIAVIISSTQEALGLLVCQDASPGRKPLEEKPGVHRSHGQELKLELLLNHNWTQQ